MVDEIGLDVLDGEDLLHAVLLLELGKDLQHRVVGLFEGVIFLRKLDLTLGSFHCSHLFLVNKIFERLNRRLHPVLGVRHHFVNFLQLVLRSLSPVILLEVLVLIDMIISTNFAENQLMDFAKHIDHEPVEWADMHELVLHRNWLLVVPRHLHWYPLICVRLGHLKMIILKMIIYTYYFQHLH